MPKNMCTCDTFWGNGSFDSAPFHSAPLKMTSQLKCVNCNLKLSDKPEFDEVLLCADCALSSLYYTGCGNVRSPVCENSVDRVYFLLKIDKKLLNLLGI